MQETCYDEIISDVDVLKKYLAVRDAFPLKALKHTRVIALSGMTIPSIELWRESLSKQVKNPAAVDMYFYSDYKIVRYVDATMAVPLIARWLSSRVLLALCLETVPSCVRVWLL